MKTPITSCPWVLSRWAATELSTPPLMAKSTRAFIKVLSKALVEDFEPSAVCRGGLPPSQDSGTLKTCRHDTQQLLWQGANCFASWPGRPVGYSRQHAFKRSAQSTGQRPLLADSAGELAAANGRRRFRIFALVR